MDEGKNLDYLKKLDYNIILKKNKNRFILYIPELCCIAEDELLEKAYEKLELEKGKLFQKAIESELQHLIKEPQEKKVKGMKMVLYNLYPFFVKIGITLIVFLLSFSFILGLSSKMIDEKIEEIKPRISLSYLIVRELSHLEEASKYLANLPEEERKKQIVHLRRILERLEPYINEIRILLKKEQYDIPPKRSNE